MASAVREPTTAGKGGGAKPPEAETFLAFERSPEAANLSTFLKFRNAKKITDF